MKENTEIQNSQTIENEIQDIIKDIASNLKEINDLSVLTNEYISKFKDTITEIKKINNRCDEIKEHVKNVLGRAILLSNYKTN